MSTPKEDWRTLCSRRKQKQNENIPPEWRIQVPSKDVQNVMDVPYTCGLLSPEELALTDRDLDDLVADLTSGKLKSEDATRAFLKRAIVAHQVTNCLTEIFVDRALDRAREVDKYMEEHGKPMGPLHGLPISLKDQFTMKGLETIMGYASNIGKFADHDCVLVEMLYELGAVPFVRTNVPQTLMWGETQNNVFGRTTNPYNHHLTAGGSSGGEGALLAMNGSPLGVGTDIDGSLRIPSAFCGLYTLRPSYERLPYHGAANALTGQESISSVLGPMSHSLGSLKLFTKALVDARPWERDPLVVRKPWNEDEYRLVDHDRGKRMCFGMLWDNKVVKPHPPLKRAMEMVKRALEEAGHVVIDWEPLNHVDIYRVAQTILVADGGEDYRRDCEVSGEPLITSMSPEKDAHQIDLEVSLVKMLTGPPRSRSAYELWQLHTEKRNLRKAYLDHWNATAKRTGTGRPVDAIISPAVAYTAVPHGLNYDSFYTTLGNAMDYACSGFPVTVVDPEQDMPHDPHDFHNHEDAAFYKLYHHELFAGLPVGLQLIGRTLEEEAVIGMTEIVDGIVKDYKKRNNLQ
ncbi:general amidase [Coniophora puteana RWD-64-598 SS2]|uniref:General amidase n=1 Tax=Coniophora puteana (strain RWD-64-598) TaxID=741705 RepID=A0A5M3M9I0_CONPW|nr:general amidase [Coniophora puteana RWD-64-598 SS2]EIW75737.1 general amidase [Coniophora puteana RWD-64-598 SS2]